MFGGGAGHITAMIANLRNNEALRKKKSYFKTMQDYLKATGGQKYTLRHGTKEELEEIRKIIIIYRRRELRETIIAIVITLIIAISIIWFTLSRLF